MDMGMGIMKVRLRPHQRSDARKLLKHFESSRCAQVRAATGYGKTVLARHVAFKLDCAHLLVVTPTIALNAQWARQLMDDGFAVLVVSTRQGPVAEQAGVEFTTSSDKIAEFWLDHAGERIAIVTTLSSASRDAFYDAEPEDHTNALLKGIKQAYAEAMKSHAAEVVKDMFMDVATGELRYWFGLTIIDESHRTANGKEDSVFGRVLKPERFDSERMLTMTATPKVVALDWQEGIANPLYSQDNEDLFGEVVVDRSYAELLALGVVAPWVVYSYDEAKSYYIAREPKEKLAVELGDAVHIQDLTPADLNACYALLSAIKAGHARHIVSYAPRIADLHRRVELLRTLARLHWLGVEVDLITNMDGLSERQEKMRRVWSENPDSAGVLFQVNTLTEGIDIPSIDGVQFGDRTSSIVRIVQLIGRGTRVDPDSPEKELAVLVPAGEDGGLFVDQVYDIFQAAISQELVKESFFKARPARQAVKTGIFEKLNAADRRLMRDTHEVEVRRLSYDPIKRLIDGARRQREEGLVGPMIPKDLVIEDEWGDFRIGMAFNSWRYGYMDEATVGMEELSFSRSHRERQRMDPKIEEAILVAHIEGHHNHGISKLVGCDGSVVRRVLKEAGLEPHPGRREDAHVAKIIAAHSNGLVNHQISQSVGVSVSMIERVLRGAGLEPNRKANVPAEAILEAHRQGLKNFEIAKMVGCSGNWVSQVLAEHQLVSNGRARTRPELDDQILQAHGRGLNVSQIAMELDTRQWRVDTVLNEHGLVSNGVKKRDPTKEAAVLEAHGRGLTRHAIARELGVADGGIVDRVLREHGLMPNPRSDGR